MTIRKILASSGLALCLTGFLSFPAYSGSESVETPDSSNIGDTFGPNNIIGLIQRLTNQIRGARATVSDNGRLITITLPDSQVNLMLERFRGEVRLQIAKYTVNDVDVLAQFADGATLGDVLASAIALLQQTDPARAARIEVLLDQLNVVLAALNASSSFPPSQGLLIAANLEALSGELRALDQPGGTLVAQAETDTTAASTTQPEVVYEPSVGGTVVETVTTHNETVRSLSDEDAIALAANTSFVVVADILEQIAGELRGNPVPDEKLASIEDILISLR
ncbi:MAG: hypothetical protein ACO331_15635 [Prochlorothrix sp.]